MPNCLACPIIEECQQAKKSIKPVLAQAAQIRDCVLVSYLKNAMDDFLSIGLGDHKGYIPSTPDIRTERYLAPEVSAKRLDVAEKQK